MATAPTSRTSRTHYDLDHGDRRHRSARRLAGYGLAVLAVLGGSAVGPNSPGSAVSADSPRQAQVQPAEDPPFQ